MDSDTDSSSDHMDRTSARKVSSNPSSPRKALPDSMHDIESGQYHKDDDNREAMAKGTPTEEVPVRVINRAQSTTQSPVRRPVSQQLSLTNEPRGVAAAREFRAPKKNKIQDPVDQQVDEMLWKSLNILQQATDLTNAVRELLWQRSTRTGRFDDGSAARNEEAKRTIKLSSKRLREYKVAFDAFDADNSGDIDADELRVAIRSLGYTPGPGDIDKLMARYDTDGSGGITFEEFVQMMTHAHSFKRSHKTTLRKSHIAHYKKVFDTFDSDGSGGISFDELKAALEHFKLDTSDSEVQRLMDEYDSDKNGTIEFLEFMNMIMDSSFKKKDQAKMFSHATMKMVQDIDEKIKSLQAPSEPAPFSYTHENGMAVDDMFKYCMGILFVFQVIFIILFGVCSKMSYIEENFTGVYQMFTGIEIMMFFGFGYLMTFLKRYGMGAAGFTMLITVVGLQWGILTEAFFKQWYANEWGYIHVDILVCSEGMFLVAAILISYGAIIGKASPLQLVVMTLLEAVFYSINKAVLLLGVVDLVDAGGTVNIHQFGAYFGLAVAWMIGKPQASADGEGGHISDLFSLIGTIFLWVYWPSFNGGALIPDSHGHQRALGGTIMALSAATVGAYFTSSLLSTSWKLRPVDIQNATLSGGVALGAVCHMTLGVEDTLLIGLSAGVASTIAYNRLQEVLDDWGVHDTCGIHNLHGIPSLIGGFASVILAGYKGPMDHDIPSIMEHRDQWKHQIASIFMTMGMAIATGLFTGYILSMIPLKQETTTVYADAPFWEVMDDFGRSLESEMERNMSEIEKGLEASRALQTIVEEYTQMGFEIAPGNTRQKSMKTLQIV